MNAENKGRLIVIGAGGRLFIGHTHLTDVSLADNTAHEFEGFRQLVSFEQPVQTQQGVGIRQANQIVPMAACEGPVNIWIKADYWMWPDEDARASKRLIDLLASIEKAEMLSRANEAGIITSLNG